MKCCRKAGNLKPKLEKTETLRNEMLQKAGNLKPKLEKAETFRNEMLQKAGNLKSNLEISETLRNEINPTWKKQKFSEMKYCRKLEI